MMFNFRFNRNGKRRSSKKKRYDQSKETPFFLYVVVKVYSYSGSLQFTFMVFENHYQLALFLCLYLITEHNKKFSKLNIKSV